MLVVLRILYIIYVLCDVAKYMYCIHCRRPGKPALNPAS